MLFYDLLQHLEIAHTAFMLAQPQAQDTAGGVIYGAVKAQHSPI